MLWAWSLLFCRPHHHCRSGRDWLMPVFNRVWRRELCRQDYMWRLHYRIQLHEYSPRPRVSHHTQLCWEQWKKRRLESGLHSMPRRRYLFRPWDMQCGCRRIGHLRLLQRVFRRFVRDSAVCSLHCRGVQRGCFNWRLCVPMHRMPRRRPLQRFVRHHSK